MYDNIERELKLLINEKIYNELLHSYDFHNSITQTNTYFDTENQDVKKQRGAVRIRTIQDKKIFTFGGGHSDDIEIRKEANSWYPQEEPTPEEVLEGVNNLIANDYKLDYVITHEPPSSIKLCLGIDMFHRLECDAFFEQIKEKCEFKHWFFGKCHENRFIPPRFSVLFDEVVPLDE